MPLAGARSKDVSRSKRHKRQFRLLTRGHIRNALKDLCSRKRQFENLTESDFILSIEQKGVDMKLGLDIASLAYKRQVEKIVLISGDSEFVPAAKLARREGIDFILDPLSNHIAPGLSEHVDGIRTCDNKFRPTP